MTKPVFKLAECLIRRKELEQKVDLLKRVDAQALYEVKANRVKVTDSLEDIVAHVPKLTASQVTREHDWHARQLRLIDAAIQQANWTCDVELPESVMSDYFEKE